MWFCSYLFVVCMVYVIQSFSWKSRGPHGTPLTEIHCSTSLIWNTFLSDEYLATCAQICTHAFMRSPWLLCFNKNLNVSVDSCETLPFRFHENPFRCSRVNTCGRADMEKLIGASLRLPPPPKRDKEDLRICTQISVPNSHYKNVVSYSHWPKCATGSN